MSSRAGASSSSSTVSAGSASSLQLRSSTLTDMSLFRVPEGATPQTPVLVLMHCSDEDPRGHRGGGALVRGGLGDDAVQARAPEGDGGARAATADAGTDGADGGEPAVRELARERQEDARAAGVG